MFFQDFQVLKYQKLCEFHMVVVVLRNPNPIILVYKSFAILELATLSDFMAMSYLTSPTNIDHACVDLDLAQCSSPPNAKPLRLNRFVIKLSFHRSRKCLMFDLQPYHPGMN